MDLLSKILNNDADARETFEQIMLSKVAEVINNTGLSESVVVESIDHVVKKSQDKQTRMIITVQS